MTKPFPACYWVVPGRLLAGEYPRTQSDAQSRAKLYALRQAGIEVFIDLTTPEDRLMPYEHYLQGAQRFSFPIPDVSVPHSPSVTRAILNCIDTHLSAGRGVYVHCWGGVGRTGLIVGCWLSEHGFPGEQALAALQQRWQQCAKSHDRSTPETEQQRTYVRTWIDQQ